MFPVFLIEIDCYDEDKGVQYFWCTLHWSYIPFITRQVKSQGLPLVQQQKWQEGYKIVVKQESNVSFTPQLLHDRLSSRVESQNEFLYSYHCHP